MSAPESREARMPSTSPLHAVTKPVRGSKYSADFAFAPTRDEIYVPISIRKPTGRGPFPAITMGRGNGRGGMAHIERETGRLAAMQDRMIERGYVVAYVNYRNEVPHLYEKLQESQRPYGNMSDDMSGGEGRVLKSAPALDSDDFVSAVEYLARLPYVKARAIGAVGVSHGGEIILKAAAAGAQLAAGVVIEGASHEFLGVDTGPAAPRKANELQYQEVEVARARADKARAMERIGRIAVPILHIGRERDHLQGIFRLAHEWMLEAGKNSTWACFDHPDHGYPYIYRGTRGAHRPDPVQRQAFELFMDYFDKHLKPGRPGVRDKTRGRGR
jgi:dienelactone hydrolase